MANKVGDAEEMETHVAHHNSPALNVFANALKESQVEEKTGGINYFLNALREPTCVVKKEGEEDGNELYRSITQYAEEKVCRKCKGLILKGEDTTNYDMIPGAVNAVLHKLRNAAQRTRKLKTREQLDEILARVSCAVQNSEMYDICNSPDDDPFVDANLAGKFDDGHDFDEKSKKTKKNEKNVTDDLLLNTEVTSELSRGIMIELDSWFSTTQLEWERICATHYSPSFITSDLGMVEILKKVQDFGETTRRLEELVKTKLGDVLRQIPNMYQKTNSPKESDCESDDSTSDLDSSGSEDSLLILPLGQHMDEISKRSHIPDDYQSFGQKHIKENFRTIKQALNLGQRVTKSKALKKTFMWSRKRLKLITIAQEERDRRISEVEMEIFKKNKKIENLKSLYELENAENLKNLQVVTERNGVLLKTINDLEIALANSVTPEQIMPDYESRSEASFNDELKIPEITKNESVYTPSQSVEDEYQSQITLSPNEINALSRDRSNMRLDMLKVSQENRELKSKNKELESVVRKLEEDLHKIENDCSAKDEEINDLKKQREINIENNSMLLNEKMALEARIEELEKKVEQQSELTKKEEEMKKDDSDLDVTTSIPTENVSKKTNEMDKVRNKDTISKTLHYQAMSMMKKEWDMEVRRLREFIINEQHRFQASLRRVHLEHEKQMDKNRADNAHIMNVLHRFRITIMKLMSKDNTLYPSCRYEISPKNKEELTLYERGEIENLSESVVEILLNLERSLETFLLSKELKVKETNAFKVSAEKDLENKCAYVVKLEHQLKQLNVAIKSVCDERSLLSNEYKKLLLSNHETQQNNNHIMEDKSKKDNGSSRRKSQDAEFGFGMSQQTTSNAVTSCKKSRMIIENLFERNVLSESDYNAANETVQHSSQLSNQQLALLVKQYVHFRKNNQIKEYINTSSKQYNDKTCFTEFLTMADRRYQNSLKKFQLQKMQLRKKRENLFLTLGGFFLKNNQDFLSIVPLAMTNQVSAVKLEKPEKGQHRVVPIKCHKSELNDVIGKKMNTGDNKANSYWQFPPDLPRNITISTPKILDMDVNPWRKIIQVNSRKGNCGLRLPPIASVYS